VAGNGDSFLELSLDLFQTAAVKPVIEAARANRRGIIFLSAAPNQPGPWRLQACALTQRSCEKIRKIMAEEIGLQKLG
jgi:hypothetical protein